MAGAASTGWAGPVDRVGARRRADGVGAVAVDRAPPHVVHGPESARPYRGRLARGGRRCHDRRGATHAHLALSVRRRAALPRAGAEPVARRRSADREQPHARRLPRVLRARPRAALPHARQRRRDLLGASRGHARADHARARGGRLHPGRGLLHCHGGHGGHRDLALDRGDHRRAWRGHARLGSDRVLGPFPDQRRHDLSGGAGSTRRGRSGHDGVAPHARPPALARRGGEHAGVAAAMAQHQIRADVGGDCRRGLGARVVADARERTARPQPGVTRAAGRSLQRHPRGLVRLLLRLLGHAPAERALRQHGADEAGQHHLRRARAPLRPGVRAPGLRPRLRAGGVWPMDHDATRRRAAPPGPGSGARRGRAHVHRGRVPHLVGRIGGAGTADDVGPAALDAAHGRADWIGGHRTGAPRRATRTHLAGRGTLRRVDLRAGRPARGQWTRRHVVAARMALAPLAHLAPGAHLHRP